MVNETNKNADMITHNKQAVSKDTILLPKKETKSPSH